MPSQAKPLSQLALQAFSTAPLFHVKTVARQTGVPAPTIRAWERRYGILAPQRGPNTYRLYSERDIAIVRWLREVIESGLTISQAIAWLRSTTLTPASAQYLEEAQPASTGLAHQPLLTEAIPREQRNDTAGAVQTTAIQAHQLTVLEEDLLAACVRLDEAAAHRALAAMFATFSVEQVIMDMLHPLLITMGERWEHGQLSITVEHFASMLIRGRLDTLYHAQPISVSGPLVLVGCAPGEQHELGALILALFLRRRSSGLRIAYLGQNVEPAHLLETIQTQRPAVVCLSAAMPERRPALAALARHISTLPLQHRPALVYGGRGFVQATEEIEGIFLGTEALQAVALIERLCLQRPSFHA